MQNLALLLFYTKGNNKKKQKQKVQNWNYCIQGLWFLKLFWNPKTQNPRKDETKQCKNHRIFEHKRRGFLVKDSLVYSPKFQGKWIFFFSFKNTITSLHPKDVNLFNKVFKKILEYYLIMKFIGVDGVLSGSVDSTICFLNYLSRIIMTCWWRYWWSMRDLQPFMKYQFLPLFLIMLQLYHMRNTKITINYRKTIL